MGVHSKHEPAARFCIARETASTELALTLTRVALNSRHVDEFVGDAAEVLCNSPLQVERLFVSMRALHPAFRARTYLWTQQTSRVHMVEWPRGLENRPGYYRSPDYFVHATGSELRVQRPGEGGEQICDLYETLRTGGYTDYLIVPLRWADGVINTLSIATRSADGFRDRDLGQFRDAVPLFALALERHAAHETLNTVLDVYLGRSVGQQILHGQIWPGSGELIDTAILIADLHAFTRHTTRLDPPATVRLLNSYFDCVVEPITEHGGQVLKFIGDAVLAFFPNLAAGPIPAPLQAVRAIRDRLRALNEVRTKAGQAALRHALCCHYGRVLYGNIGSSNRLDFTIIGEAVNLTARGVETAKARQIEYLFTADFVECFGTAGLVFAGSHLLRGMAEPISMFTFENAATKATEVGQEVLCKNSSAKDIRPTWSRDFQ
jgi:adenylate cyclase